MALLAAIVIVLFGIAAVGLAVGVFVHRPFATRFLEAFAQTARAHYTEQAVRLVLGAALLIRAPALWHPVVFQVLGWTLIVTSAGLLLLPWQWHHRFAARVIPPVLRFRRLYALGLCAFGALLLYGVLHPLR